MKIRYLYNPENLLLSPTLRLIGIILRRGILENIVSISNLLDEDSASSHLHNLQIKPEFLDQPIFLVSVPGGRGLNPDKLPLSTDSLGAFFKHRVLATGFPRNISFYSWRRGLATVANRATNRNTVRAILGYKADRTTFE
jgi:hypothetical protein